MVDTAGQRSAANCLLCLLTRCLDPKTWYTVYITTSDVRSAGTDADVHIALTGSQGSSGRVDLPSQPQQYQRGQRDKTRYGCTTLVLHASLASVLNEREAVAIGGRL
jgi:hypothetical protein